MSISSVCFTQKRLVARLLEEAMRDAAEGGDEFEHWGWTLQGLGMLRLYLGEDKALRLHVWDDRYAAPGVSEMHTHPWDMVSLVVAGEVHNTRFSAGLGTEANFMQQRLHCGTGGGLVNEPRPCNLRKHPTERYRAGESYNQTDFEIHVSEPLRGTVTLVHRTVGNDPDKAYVFWPLGKEWVSAEPRPAHADEVYAILDNSLEAWF